ncbi:MAG: hypothetical protein CSA20_09110 [Deltaproteobacteria bacterium]|nr:MAG: hypothetical protein CSB23_05480 [Deltaproteobacteria bacterium]PIE72179.1 MAG: hypothetical protein CSA20_09110 [Deltaproteobacteria bacterium]
MSNVKNKITFAASAILYLVFNLRLGSDLSSSLVATGWQILQTMPYVAGLTYVVIAFMQYMAGGQKLPWERRLRLFFALGIIAGLLFGIYEYAGVDVTASR